MLPKRNNAYEEDDFDKCSSKSSINSKLEEFNENLYDNNIKTSN